MLGDFADPETVAIDYRSIRPWCAECRSPINPLRLNDAIGLVMPDGSQRVVGLCRPCLDSLDRASPTETAWRLRAMRVRVLS